MAMLLDVENPFAPMGPEDMGTVGETDEEKRRRLMAAFEAAGTPPSVETLAPAPEAAPAQPDTRRRVLEALAGIGEAPPAPDMEAEALADLRATQAGVQRGEAFLPYMTAAQRITEGLTGAPADLATVQALGKTLRSREADAQARLQAAQGFARRAAEERALGLRMTAEAAQNQAKATAEAKKLAFDQAAKLEELRQKEVELAIKAKQASETKTTDPLLQEKRLLELQKLQAEVDMLKSGTPTPKQEIERLRLEKLRQDVAGESPTKIKAAEVSATTIKDLVQRLKDLYQKHGAQPIGPAAEEMEQIATMISLEAKGEGMAQLGALSGPDQAILFKIQGSKPTQFFRDVFGLGDPVRSMDSLLFWVDSRLGAVKKAYGPKAPEQPKKTAGKKSRFPITVQDRDTGTRYRINTQEELDAVRPMADKLLVVE